MSFYHVTYQDVHVKWIHSYLWMRLCRRRHTSLLRSSSVPVATASWHEPCRGPMCLKGDGFMHRCIKPVGFRIRWDVVVTVTVLDGQEPGASPPINTSRSMAPCEHHCKGTTSSWWMKTTISEYLRYKYRYSKFLTTLVTSILINISC